MPTCEILHPNPDWYRRGTNEIWPVTYGKRTAFAKQANRQDAANELAAYRISQAIGFRVVPFTIISALPQVTTLPVVISERIVGDHAYGQQDQIRPIDAQMIGVLDVIICNGDRHPGNAIIDAATGATKAIDHGYAFYNSDHGSSIFVRGQTMLPEVKAKIKAIRPGRIKKILDDTGIDADKTEWVLKRLAKIKQMDRIDWGC